MPSLVNIFYLDRFHGLIHKLFPKRDLLRRSLVKDGILNPRASFVQG
jgi:hypothetical protein